SARHAGRYGRPILFQGRLVPAEKGRVRLYRGGRFVGAAPVRTGGSFRLRPRLVSPGPWQARFQGAGSPPVPLLVRPRPRPRLHSTLASLHYAVRRTGSFGPELVDSLYAFQKVQGLPRTGVADAATWRALAHPRLARPRYSSPADHLEVDKGHQVLYVVRGGQVALITPVSTAGIPGHLTPEGRFAIYRK